MILALSQETTDCIRWAGMLHYLGQEIGARPPPSFTASLNFIHCLWYLTYQPHKCVTQACT